MAQQLTQLQDVSNNLMRMEDDFKSVLPSNIDPKKFVAVVITAIQMNPELLNKNRQSLFNASRQCAQDGLIPDGREAALVAFKDEVKCMPMAMGLVKKLNEAGVSVNPQVVHKNDVFSYWVDEIGPHIKHEPNVFGGDRGEPVGVYCVAKIMGQHTQVEVMSKDDVEKVRKTSRMPNSLMWTSFWGEGAKKTVIRRIYKWLPKEPKLEEIFKRDDEDNFDFNGTDATPAPQVTKSDRLSNIIDAQGGPAPEVTAAPAPAKTEAVKEADPAKPITQGKAPGAVENSEFAEGIIEQLKVAESAKRFGCVMNGVTYGTSDAPLYAQMEQAADKKHKIRIAYVKKPGKAAGTLINEAVHLLVLDQAKMESPV